MINQESAYCDRNICLKNEYSGIGCEDCVVMVINGDASVNNTEAMREMRKKEVVDGN